MTLAVPDWVAPPERQLTDCRLLAEAAYGPASDRPYLAGIASALRWVVGTQRSPLTEAENPASPASAEEEFFVAGKVELQQSPLSAAVPAAQAQGVARALAWVLGWEHSPPIDLPRRPVPSAAQLYEEAVTAEPWKYRLPERQLAARLVADREAARLTRLAAYVDSL